MFLKPIEQQPGVFAMCIHCCARCGLEALLPWKRGDRRPMQRRRGRGISPDAKRRAALRFRCSIHGRLLVEQIQVHDLRHVELMAIEEHDFYDTLILPAP